MTSLTGQIDRFSRNTKAIKATAATTAISQPSLSGPFTSAVLSTPLGDLIRDVDPSELGLFSLVSPGPTHFREQDAQGAPATGVIRTEFPAPTPLRKPGYQRDIPKPNDLEPEIYVQAALKYIDLYQTIRPMPRARSQVIEILDRLNAVRTNIQTFSDMLHQIQSTRHVPSKKLTEDEDKHIHDLQSRATQLKQRKQTVLAQRNASTQSRKSLDIAKPEVAPASPHEDKFWNTPVATARSLRFTDNLLDEELQAGDISEISSRSPNPLNPPLTWINRSVSPFLDVEEFSRNDLNDTLSVASPQPPNDVQLYDVSITAPHNEDRGDEEHIRRSSEVERDSPSVCFASQPSPAAGMNADIVSQTYGMKIKVNSEVERIIARIWATVGEVIMPGHPFNTTTTTSKPPRGKETIAHLQSLSVLSPPPGSPSSSSISSASNVVLVVPTSQQILTAYLLLQLLACPPHFSMPLTRARDILASKVKGGGNSISTGQGAARVLYGCVAKRLIKIERGGGEQIVRFDI